MITPSAVSIVLGPFRLLSPLGRGGSADVWRAVHERQDVPVAIKVIRDASTDDVLDRTAEVRALAALDHPNLLMVFDHGEVPAAGRALGLVPGSPWIATELCSGGSLAQVGPRNWNQLRRVLQDVLAGLAYAHARGVLHRDLTPENVLISASTDVRPGLKLGDFGLSSDHRVAQHSGRGPRVAGTPAYMAPEQFRGDLSEHGPWTDMYAFGCLAWRLCSGQPPFGSARPPEVLAAAHADLDPPPLDARFAVPTGLDVLLRALLAKRPADRVQSAAETLAALDVVDGQPSRGVPADWRTGTHRRPAMRLIGAGLGLHPHRAVPLVGRDAERDALWAALVDARRRGDVRVVHVTGAGGLGKQSLARWLAERALETGAARVSEVEGRGLDPYAAIADALARAQPTPPLCRVSAQLAEPAGEDSRAVLPVVERPAAQGAALRALARAARAAGPLVLLVPHADENPGVVAALAALRAPYDGPRSHGMLVVLTSRSADPAEVDTPRIELAPLSPAHQVQLVEGVLGLGGPVAQRVRERAAGNPAFAVAMANDLIRRGELVAGEHGFEAPPGAAPDLPADLASTWRARLEEAIPALDPRCVELAALLGPEVRGDTWQRARAALRLTDEPWLALGQFALTTRTPRGYRWERHALDAARRLWPRSPVAFHAACAKALAADSAGGEPDLPRAALHFAAACRPIDAARALQRAALAAALRDPALTVQLIQQRDVALVDAHLPPADALWGEGWVLAVRARVELGDWAAAEEPAERLLQAAWTHGWAQLLAPSLVLRGEIARAMGGLVLARERLKEALDLCAGRGDDRGVARSALALGRLWLHLGRLGDAGRCFQQAQALYTRLQNRAGAGACLLLRAEVARFGGNSQLARDLAGQLRHEQARHADRSPVDALGAVLLRLVEADLQRDAGGPASPAYQAALVDAEGAGASSLVARAAVGLGLCGDVRAFQRAVDEAGRVHDRPLLALALACQLPHVPERTFGAQVERVLAALAETGCYHPDIRPALLRAADKALTAQAATLRAAAARQAAMVQK